MGSTTDWMVDALTKLLCSDSDGESTAAITGYFGEKKNGLVRVDVGARLEFLAMRPEKTTLLQMDAGRVMTENPTLLSPNIQDILGAKSEAAVMSAEALRWIGVRKLTKRPKGVWVSRPGADIYSVHLRTIYPDGTNDYRARVAAFDKAGRPVLATIEGQKRNGYARELDFATAAASIIDDSRRPGVALCTVSDSVSITFPVEYGEHLEIFKLREGPLTATQRRKALLHRVAKYQKSNGTEVQPFTRGVSSFDIDGLRVELAI